MSTTAGTPTATPTPTPTATPPSTSTSTSTSTLGVPYDNITSSISSRVGINLHRQPHHPINIIKTHIENYFTTTYQDEKGKPLFKYVDDLPPRVSVQQCFDDLLVKPDHPSRAITDTFYYDETSLLRTHTSAHQTQLMRSGYRAFLCTGDCYRRDEIDTSHYPVFHQMEGVRVFPFSIADRSSTGVTYVVNDLKSTLEGLVRHIFGANVKTRWVDAYFPFTDPSLELEVFYNDKWMEVLGSGVIETRILDNCGLSDHSGWAFGIGLERLAMVLFDIPDIRLFWSTDPRFLDQFSSPSAIASNARGHFIKFQPFSKYPPCLKDVSVWLPEKQPHDNDVCAVIRDVAGDLVENVTLMSSFTHPKTQRVSRLYRITYRSLQRSLTNEEIDTLQWQVRDALVKQLGVELR